MRFFYDEITETIISYDELKDVYKECKASGFLEVDDTFSKWFENVQSYNNGTFTEVYQFSISAIADGKKISFVSFGSNAENACKRYAVENDMWEYPIVISANVINS